MSRPWFPFYVGDYVRDTARLTTEAHGAYLLLMLDYWVNGAPPDDDDVLATITKLPVTVWRKRRKSLATFFDIKNGLWTHKRIEKEREKAIVVGSSNSDKAREAAEKRWAMEREKKLREQSEQCSGDAPSINQALLQNAQSQPPSHSKPDSKKGESNSPPKNFDVIEGSGAALPITESYEPSDRAIEYAFSLGMKKADLNSELSKFVAMSMATRAVSFNHDMSFKVWCDRWLDHKRKKDPDFVPEKVSETGARITKIFVEVGTLAWTCWVQWHRDNGRMPPIQRDTRVENVIKTGWWFDSEYPPGYDEATGEYRPADKEDAA